MTVRLGADRVDPAGGTTFELTANAQIWPRALNSTLGGDDDGIYLIVADLGSPSGQGLDFIGAPPLSSRPPPMC